jgi:hypothetical protein
MPLLSCDGTAIEDWVRVRNRRKHGVWCDLVHAVEGDADLVARVEALEPIHVVGDGGFLAVLGGAVVVPAGPSARERRKAIESALSRGLKVLTEVGKKDASAQPAPSYLRQQILSDLEAGAGYVIVEGRESGKGVGIYDEHGGVRADDVEELVAGLPDPSRILWEAPLKSQQEALIKRFGANVSLGNLAPGEIMALETLRRGLRSDSLRLCIAGQTA